MYFLRCILQTDQQRELLMKFNKTKGLDVQYLTGIPGIDLQHNELHKICNAARKAAGDELPKDLLIHSVQEIIKVFKEHCYTEEYLMEMVEYPDSVIHKSQHRKLITMFLNELNKDEETDMHQIIRDIEKEILAHIALFDRKYTTYIEDLITYRNKFSITVLNARLLAG